MSYNNPEFQAYVETVGGSDKHRLMLWNTWVEATRVAEFKSKAAQEQSLKCHCGRKLSAPKGLCNVCDNDE